MDLPVKSDDSEEVEEGEIDGSVVVVVDYDPALEYPDHIEVSSQYPPLQYPRTSSPSPPPAASASSSSKDSKDKNKNKTTVLRLICLKSSVLERRRQRCTRRRLVAALDGHAEVSVGRDVASSARIRLKEMAVSKFHASIYWDGARREWGIVDMGSVHGTFVRSVQDPSTSMSSSQQALPLGTRLSEPRKASMPRALRHLDEITIGGTTFLVHEHLSGRPCAECTIDGEAEIPLFSFSRASSGPNNNTLSSGDELSRKRKYMTDDGDRDDVKKSMAKLRSSLLSRHALPSSVLPSSPNAAAYKDRSARRRELHPEPRIPAVSSPARSSESHPLPIPIPTPRTPTPPPPLPPPPVPSSNIGHKLLLLQGWNPGMTLGEDPDIGLLEPLAVSGNVHRAGLGSSVQMQTSHIPSQAPENWKEEARRRRWDGIKGM